MADNLLSETYDSNRPIDFDDSDVIESNAFRETHNNNETDLIMAYQKQIEKLTSDKLTMQSQLNGKIVELQMQVLKLTNTIEKCEVSKAELKTELTKLNAELRHAQRQLISRSNDVETIKSELINNFKSAEFEYQKEIGSLKQEIKSLNGKLFVEKDSKETYNEHANSFQMKVKELENDISKYMDSEIRLKGYISELELKNSEFIDKYDNVSKQSSRYLEEIRGKDSQIESMKVSESKLKILVAELNSKANKLETELFEARQALFDSKNFQNELQGQLLNLQEVQILKEKEYNLLLDKASTYSKKLKETEDSLAGQSKIVTNYRDQLKSSEMQKTLLDLNIKEQNEMLKKTVEELETKVNIQSRLLSEANEEISCSRESESVAVTNLQMTLAELEKLAETSGKNGSPDNTIIPLTAADCDFEKLYTNSKVKEEMSAHATTKNIIKNLRQTIRSFQSRVHYLDGDKTEALDKIQNQEKEIKNLKFQIRKLITHQKTIETENSEKQSEIDNLSGEILNLKAALNSLRSDKTKTRVQCKENVDGLKRLLNQVSDESRENIESRDMYLQSLLLAIKEVINKERNYIQCAKADCQSNRENCDMTKSGLDPNFCHGRNTEFSTQVNAGDNQVFRENFGLIGSVSGTFCFHNQNSKEATTITNRRENDKRIHQQNGNSDGRIQIDQYNNPEEKRKPAIKKVSKKTETKLDPYVDSVQSWPAIREVISHELAALLSRYDIQRAQCSQLMTELANKDNIISHMMATQHKNLANSLVKHQNQGTAVEEPIASVTTRHANKPTNQSYSLLKNSAECKRKGMPKTRNESNSNAAMKRTVKMENQKPLSNTQPFQTHKCDPSNRRATTTSIKAQAKTNTTKEACALNQNCWTSARNNLSIQKQTSISFPNTQAVISTCQKTVDCEGTSLSPVEFNRNLVFLFVSVLVNMIRFRSDAAVQSTLIKYYKMFYHRSVDSSKLILFNNALEQLIDQSNNPRSNFRIKMDFRRRRLRIYVHVVIVCVHLKKIVLATKLFVGCDCEHLSAKGLIDFTTDLCGQLTDTNDICLASNGSLEKIINDCVQYFMDNNAHQMFIMKRPKLPMDNAIFTSSGAILIERVNKNLLTLQNLIKSQISRQYFSTKQKSYESNLKNLIFKIKDLGEIINTQSTVIGMKESENSTISDSVTLLNKEILQLKNLLNKKDEAVQILSDQLKKQTSSVVQTKSYLSNVINLCEHFLNRDMFVYDELMCNEETIYRTLKSDDDNVNDDEANDFIDCIRDAIRMALRLSCSVKSILM